MLPKEPSTVGLEGAAIHHRQGTDTLRNGFYTCPACGVPHRDGGDSKASTSLKHPTHQAWGIHRLCLRPICILQNNLLMLVPDITLWKTGVRVHMELHGWAHCRCLTQLNTLESMKESLPFTSSHVTQTAKQLMMNQAPSIPVKFRARDKIKYKKKNPEYNGRGQHNWWNEIFNMSNLHSLKYIT